MERTKIGYGIVLIVGLVSSGTLESVERAIATRPVLETCECWAASDDAQLEVGTIVLNFSENPTIQSLPSTIYSNKNDHIFFIPAADIAQQLPAMLKAENKKNPWYTIAVSRETKPIPGIKIVLSYDPEKVSVQQTVFNTLGTQKGISFRLYNQSMIKVLKARGERSLLRLTQLSPLCVTA